MYIVFECAQAGEKKKRSPPDGRDHERLQIRVHTGSESIRRNPIDDGRFFTSDYLD